MREISLESPVRKCGAFVFLDRFAASFDSSKDVSRGIEWLWIDLSRLIIEAGFMFL